MRFDPAQLAAKDNHRLLLSVLVPRPIAFVSTLGPDGVANCAPFSFFMGVATHPPVVAISVGSRSGGPKDTARNILEGNGEFVVNVVTEDLAEAMVVASADWAAHVSEFEEAGLTPAPSEVVGPPRIAESPVNLECRLRAHLEVGDGPNLLLLGDVVRIHVRDDLLVDGAADVRRLRPVGRLGGAAYCRIGEVFELLRPRVDGAKAAHPTAAR